MSNEIEPRTADEIDAKGRNRFLFFEIANIMEFQPEQFNQGTWGSYVPNWYSDENIRETFADVNGYRPEATDDYNWSKVEECGTAMCIAGHAAAMTGWFPTIDTSTSCDGHHPRVSWSSVSRRKHDSYLYGESVSDVAEKALGLLPDEASRLFAGGASWTPDEIRGFGRGEPILPGDVCSA